MSEILEATLSQDPATAPGHQRGKIRTNLSYRKLYQYASFNVIDKLNSF